MDATPWDALAAPFAAADLSWRVVKLSPDRLSAQVRPQLSAASITARLDAVLGVGGWSLGFAALGERGVVCTLSVAAVTKAAAAPYTPETSVNNASVNDAAEDALVAAATLFGLQPGTVLDELPWVDYDPEQGQLLYDPSLAGEDTDTEAVSLPAALPADALSSPAAPVPPAAQAALEPQPAAKSAGQQAIDKLVDRLKAEGKGLGAAKLLNTYGGYGSDPAAARELYAKLRALLMAEAG